MLTVRYLAYFPSSGINVQNRHRISDETSRDVSQITFVVVEVKRERFVYMLQIVIEHIENSESCESAHGFLSAAYEIKRVTYKSVRFDYRVRACLYRLIFLPVHNSRLCSGVSHHCRSNRALSRFGLFAVSQGRCLQNTRGTTVKSVKNLRALLSHRWFARATSEGMADAASFK